MKFYDGYDGYQQTEFLKREVLKKLSDKTFSKLDFEALSETQQKLLLQLVEEEVNSRHLHKKHSFKGKDGYQGEYESDSYQPNDNQLNVRLTNEDMIQVKEINKNFFEDEASNSMIGRILIRKGIQFFKNLK